MSTERFVEAQRATLAHYGLEAESRFVDVGHIADRAHVLVVGEGEPVVLMNGIGTPAAMLAPLMAAMPDRSIFAIDLPGYGLTDANRGFPDDYRSQHVGFLTDTLDALGLDRPAIISNSLGSLISTWVAIESPTRVDRLVYLGCPAIALGTSAPLPMRVLSVPWLARIVSRVQPPSPSQVAQMAKMVKQHPLPPVIADLVEATQLTPAYDGVFFPSLHRLVRLTGSRPELALTPTQLGTVDVPVHLVWGRNDPMGGPEVGARIVEALPNGSIDVVDGGHCPWLTDARAVAASIAGSRTRSA